MTVLAFKDAPCPYCGRANDVHSGPHDEAPKAGDIAICWGCANLQILTEDGVRKATDEETHTLLEDPRIRRAVAAARRMEGSPLDVVRGVLESD